jgi:hypothetical protein
MNKMENTSWWILSQNRYIEFEIGPCVLLDEHGNCHALSEFDPEKSRLWILEACDRDCPDLVFWSVFGVLKDAGRESLADFKLEKSAQAVADMLNMGLDVTDRTTREECEIYERTLNHE